MQQCAWCSKTASKKWMNSNYDHSVIICLSCYRTKRNGYLACGTCHNRRFCRQLHNNKPTCDHCYPINVIDLTSVDIQIEIPSTYCAKCQTSKSMSWHLLPSGESLCLYCYHDRIGTNLLPPKKKFKAMHRSSNPFILDIEKAAEILCFLRDGIH